MNNKELLSKKQTEKITCPFCNKFISKTNMSRHKKLKHY